MPNTGHTSVSLSHLLKPVHVCPITISCIVKVKKIDLERCFEIQLVSSRKETL